MRREDGADAEDTKRRCETRQHNEAGAGGGEARRTLVWFRGSSMRGVRAKGYSGVGSSGMVAGVCGVCG